MLKFKIIGLALALVLIAGLVAVASGATGAYFSDTKDGTISGDAGTIYVETGGGTGVDNLDFHWDNMLPGVTYSTNVTYQNVGKSVQDVWLVFPNKTALSALASLGAYGAVEITSTNGAYFHSDNLNDHPVDQGGDPDGPGGRGTVEMVPQMFLLAQNVGPTASGTMTFTFQYASGFTTQNPAGLFNPWPLSTPGTAASTGWPNDGNQAGYDQHYANAADGSGSGLPFQIVATQHGIQPEATGGFAGF